VKTYLLEVELQEEEDGRWSVWIPSLPGCAAWGYSEEEALKAIQDAAQAYIEDVIESGESIPLEGGKAEIKEAPMIAVPI
jgi:predicted RNase H-like HicB family nuclease